jgi:hypothetical protein
MSPFQLHQRFLINTIVIFSLRYYDPIVKRLLDSVLDVTAIVLGEP